MSSAESSFKKGSSKFHTANKTDYALSPSRLQASTIAKSPISPSVGTDDRKATTHKRSLNFCKN